MRRFHNFQLKLAPVGLTNTKIYNACVTVITIINLVTYVNSAIQARARRASIPRLPALFVKLRRQALYPS